MRVVALISGGKDSCYNAMLCVAAGHNVVALANLQPKGKEDELDSFMYQTVGHEAVELVAKAMGLPLYRGTTSGLRSGCGLQYTPHDGDEVEDLYHLLKRVQRSEDVEGVASGAVLSNYQRLRVENVCVRLGLTSIAYLWQRDQEELLTNMIDDGLNAIIIKVATIGLRQTHLGQTLQEIKPHLKQLHSCYGVHMCGEGGEYETVTLDCPLFTHTIIIDESEVIMVTDDDIAPVAYLKLHQLHLEKKNPSVQRSLPSLPTPEISVQIPHTQTSCYGGKGKVGCGDDGRVWRGRVFEGVGDDITQQTNRIFYELTDWLKQCGCEYNDVAITQLYLSSLSDYLIVNSIYQTYYQNNPPARVCVQMSVPDGVLVRLEVLVYHRKQREGVEEREERGLVAMHVQSMSCWAPANIGPYSQSMTGGVVVFTAGQIGLDPATMSLVSPPLQPSLALNHITTVLDASHTHLTSALCGICYYTTEEAGWIARMTWGKKLGSIDGCGPVVVFARVPALPRGGCVEWSFISLTCPSSQLHHQSKCKIKDVVGMVTSDIVTWCDDDDNKTLGGAWLFTITSPPITMVDVCDTVSMCMEELTSVLASVDLCELTQLRLFIPHYASTPPPPPRSYYDDMTGVDVSITICEGYYGHNCSTSLLAILLPPS